MNKDDCKEILYVCLVLLICTTKQWLLYTSITSNCLISTGEEGKLYREREWNVTLHIMNCNKRNWLLKKRLYIVWIKACPEFQYLKPLRCQFILIYSTRMPVALPKYWIFVYDFLKNVKILAMIDCFYTKQHITNLIQLPMIIMASSLWKNQCIN